jgi:hypothetical protein
MERFCLNNLLRSTRAAKLQLYPQRSFGWKQWLVSKMCLQLQKTQTNALSKNFNANLTANTTTTTRTTAYSACR